MTEPQPTELRELRMRLAQCEAHIRRSEAKGEKPQEKRIDARARILELLDGR